MSKKGGNKYFKSGEIAEVSGQYKNIQTRQEVTVTKGEHLPPTPKKEQKYILVDPTKHKK
jgi:DNA/RNA endonuclease YhcR with UshA esterase domain